MHRLFAVTFFVLLSGVSGIVQTQQDEVKPFLEYLSKAVCRRWNEDKLIKWNYVTNITDENMQKMIDQNNTPFDVQNSTFNWRCFTDPDILRQGRKYGYIDSMTDDEYDAAEPLIERWQTVINEMTNIYDNLNVCSYKDRTICNLTMEPDMVNIFESSEDAKELEYYWTEVHDSIGRQVRKLFEEYTTLSYNLSVANHYANMADQWVDQEYEETSAEFERQVDDLWKQQEPLYLQIHAYVRKKLHARYGDNVINRTGTIPAHLLGNIWGDSWESIYEKTVPYCGETSIDVTPEMKKQGYTVQHMVKLAEEFYQSINLSSMTNSFKKYSIFEKPKNREVECVGSSYDFFNGEDFRILMCAQVKMEDLLTIYHEMGHVEYFMAYSRQPCCYRYGANPAFHEAVGDTMGLSVSTVKHLQLIGLLDKRAINDPEVKMNLLYRNALNKAAFLPYSILVDKWRWRVFKNKVSAENLNADWWKLRYDMQGVSPPVPRDEKVVDAASKYHVVNDHTYIEYFIGSVLQFQFHEALCKKAKQFNPKKPNLTPLSNCDIYGSKEAGNLLKKMLEMGSSKPWPSALKVITGKHRMDAKPMLDYFRPLYLWLVKDNKRTGERIGWK